MDMRSSGRSTREQKAEIERTTPFRVSHHSLARWDIDFDGTLKSLLRAKPNFRTGSPAKIHAAKDKAKNRKDQFDFILGHIGSKKQGLAAAHRSLEIHGQHLNWGKIITINVARQMWRKLDPMYRPAICKDKDAHFTRFAAFAVHLVCQSNEIWQADELVFEIRGDKGHSAKIYCIPVVDVSTGTVRHIEASLKPIQKVNFVAAFKKAMLPNPSFGLHACAKPIRIKVDNAKIHDAKKFQDKPIELRRPRDFLQAAAALNVLVHYNDNFMPRQNAIVENFNGNFKRQFVKDFAHFVRVTAPAMNTLEWVTHLEAFPQQMAAFCLQWNTTPQADGTSRLEKYLRNQAPGTTDVTEAEIDQAVRITLRKSLTREYGVKLAENYHYDNPALLAKHGRDIFVRVRPEGNGPDVEAYDLQGNHMGTLLRQEDHPNMGMGLLSTYKTLTKTIKEKHVYDNRRFLSYERQVALLRDNCTPAQKALIIREIDADTAGNIPFPEVGLGDAGALVPVVEISTPAWDEETL